MRQELLVTSPHHWEGVCGMMTFREFVAEPSKLTLKGDENYFHVFACDLLFYI